MENLSDKELHFLDRFDEMASVFKKKKIASMEDVVINVCQMYLTADKENDQEDCAWFIGRLNRECKEIALRCIDFDDKFNRLLNGKKKKIAKINRINQKRRHEKRDDFALTSEQWEETCNHFGCKCAYCGMDSKILTYDHFVAFSKGGSFKQDNILPCCGKCNSSKNNKDFKEWYQNQKFYSIDREEFIIDFINSKQREAMLM